MTSATLSFSPNENGKVHLIVDDSERHKYYVIVLRFSDSYKRLLTAIEHTNVERVIIRSILSHNSFILFN